jgi:hypothetical protein
MADWNDLTRELDAWQASGLTATFWWRDDDATRATQELERLLAISGETRTPVNLAVVPRDAEDSLRDRLSNHDIAFVLQHGWSHENHAPSEERQVEYGPHRPIPVMLAELAEGWKRIKRFDRALPVLVAPWNRMDAALIPSLPSTGLLAVSTLGPRDLAEPAPHVHCTNVHVDIIDWSGTGGFVGEHNALDQIIKHLTQRREGMVDANEPTGLMSHHLYHDDGCWWFIGDLFRRTSEHPTVRWLDGNEAFWQ